MEIEYIPKYKSIPKNTVEVQTAWKPNELVIGPILEDFQIKRNLALEFGVDYGYSTAVLSSYFKRVIGVDTFLGDPNAGERPENMLEIVKETLKEFPIELFKADYRTFIKGNENHYDLIHIDIVHTFDETFECGLWAANHSDIVIFHDTQSFPDVKRAVEEIAKQTGKKFYNYTERYGLGIITNESLHSDNV